jgi:uncharacterized protein YceH (UPF0502 family)
MQAQMQFSALEARIIGCLMEKQVTTPDQYPLSINALVNACNQKSNREPVLALAEPEVQQAVDGLRRRHMLLERGGFGSRVAKYQHSFCNTEFGTLRFTPQEFAIVCELLLRGPQTPGELRSHAARMASFADANEVEAALAALSARAEGPVVQQLPREAGRREQRWAQLFTPLPEGSDASAGIDATAGGSADDAGGDVIDAVAQARGTAGLPPPAHDALVERISRLEALVESLQQQLQALRTPSG